MLRFYFFVVFWVLWSDSAALPTWARPNFSLPLDSSTPLFLERDFSIQISDIFLRLFPEYISSSGPYCGRLEEGQSAGLFFYSAGLGSVLQLLIAPAEDLNAHVRGPWFSHFDVAQIVVSTPLLRRIKSKAELAFVLAHEMAHLRANQFSMEDALYLLSKEQREKLLQLRQEWERQADIAAYQTLALAGFDLNEPEVLLARIAAERGDPTDQLSSGADQTHLSIAARISALRQAWQQT